MEHHIVVLGAGVRRHDGGDRQRHPYADTHAYTLDSPITTEMPTVGTVIVAGEA